MSRSPSPSQPTPHNQPTLKEADDSPRVHLSELLEAAPGVSEALGEGSPSALSASELDRLRRSVPLSIDAQGRWWHDGEPFRHQRMISFFNRNLGWREGEATLTIGGRWCYVSCERTPFLILKLELERAEGEPPQLWAHLNTEERLPLQALSLEGEQLFAQLTPERLARFSRHAQAQCAAWLVESESASGYALSVEGRSWLIS